MSGNTFDQIMLWIATVGQVLFVLVWLTQRWWITWVGRALMFKGAALALILVATLWSYYRGPLPQWAGRSMFGVLAVAIVAQFSALALEVWRAHQEHRPVSGANGQRRRY
jgi:hypothetical protein